MSFSGTPLGQGRRLDRDTFLGKSNLTENRPPSPRHIIPTSYTYGAPTLSSRSPPKPDRSATNIGEDAEDQDAPALDRFARFKQREATLSTRPGGPKIITEPPNPERWASKDTSVNIASAFIQAAAGDMPANNPNNAWASGSTRPNAVPRSTSVEYEAEAQAATSRRLAVPPNRLPVPRNTTGRKPISKTSSVRHVPDSEGEDTLDAGGRAKSPLENVVGAVYNVAKRALPASASYYLVPRPQESEDGPTEHQTPANGKDSSYDYSAEEREVQQSRRQHIVHKRNRISVDNKAYKPTASDEGSDEDFEDDGKTRRRGKKKKEIGGPLSTLPSIGQTKRRKRKSRGDTANGPEGDDIDDEDNSIERQSTERASRPPPSRQSVPRGSAPPEDQSPNQSIDIEQALDSIPEVNEDHLDIHDPDVDEPQPHHTAPSASFSIGGLLGTAVRWGATTVTSILQFVMYMCGQIFGTAYGLILRRPLRWITSPNGVSFGKYIILGVVILAASWALRNPLTNIMPTFSTPVPVYQAPDVPAANIAELSARLQRIESALSSISMDVDRTRTKADQDTNNRAELVGRLGALESRVQKESIRAVEAEVQVKNSASQELDRVRREVLSLQERLEAQRREQHHPIPSSDSQSNDEEARVRLKSLEERVGTVEGGVKEALELGKKVTAGVGSSAGAAWWNRLASGSAAKSGLTIKSADGQDVTSLIEHLVDASVSTYGKDILARPDFALHSGGARIIPSLTSPTFEIRPPNLKSQLIGLITGNGYAIGRPPVTALHHELHNGHCWPIQGSEGQLGVALVAPTYISDITIDHVASAVAYDMRSAPRHMEVWGMVEGEDNIAAVQAWREEKIRRRANAEEDGVVVEEEEVDEYPATLPKNPLYIRIAKFTYDIHAPNNIQTFPVSQDIQDLNIDFGIVVLRVNSNWGREFTCLYRLRVHGRRMGEIPLPSPEELDSIR
ncbi:hypothetical protein BD779DRAFT_1466295 [Infundibulicybe gibba]|nr:hypothetical protein BD779DRAFT_1466295 [Infundibulicybe gibba]